MKNYLLSYNLNQNMGGLIFGIDGDGNRGYYGADGSLVPFKGTPQTLWSYAGKRGDGDVTKTYTATCEGVLIACGVHNSDTFYVYVNNEQISRVSLGVEEYRDNQTYRSLNYYTKNISKGDVIKVRKIDRANVYAAFIGT